MRIVFMGTPEFAVPSLQALLNTAHEVVAVVTAPDALGGRGGKQLIQSEVKQYALSQKLLILQPERLRDPAFLDQLKDLHADLFVVVAFRMLPEKVWNMPPLGTYNVHGSLLPKYRGAAPIHWAVIHGEKMTGVSVFKLKHVIDTGDIILQASIAIEPDETTGDVYIKLKELGASTLIKSINLVAAGQVHYLQQDERLSSPAPKLFHENAEIRTEWTSNQIHDFIRGLNPKPSAWIIFEGIKYFIHKSAFAAHDTERDKLSGSLYITGSLLYLKTIDSALEIKEIQPEGKRRMSALDFINGVRSHASFM